MWASVFGISGASAPSRGVSFHRSDLPSLTHSDRSHAHAMLDLVQVASWFVRSTKGPIGLPSMGASCGGGWSAFVLTLKNRGQTSTPSPGRPGNQLCPDPIFFGGGHSTSKTKCVRWLVPQKASFQRKGTCLALDGAMLSPGRDGMLTPWHAGNRNAFRDRRIRAKRWHSGKLRNNMQQLLKCSRDLHIS